MWVLKKHFIPQLKTQTYADTQENASYPQPLLTTLALIRPLPEPFTALSQLLSSWTSPSFFLLKYSLTHVPLGLSCFNCSEKWSQGHFFLCVSFTFTPHITFTTNLTSLAYSFLVTVCFCTRLGTPWGWGPHAPGFQQAHNEYFLVEWMNEWVSVTCALVLCLSLSS